MSDATTQGEALIAVEVEGSSSSYNVVAESLSQPLTQPQQPAVASGSSTSTTQHRRWDSFGSMAEGLPTVPASFGRTNDQAASLSHRRNMSSQGSFSASGSGFTSSSHNFSSSSQASTSTAPTSYSSSSSPIFSAEQYKPAASSPLMRSISEDHNIFAHAFQEQQSLSTLSPALHQSSVPEDGIATDDGAGPSNRVTPSVQPQHGFTFPARSPGPVSGSSSPHPSLRPRVHGRKESFGKALMQRLTSSKAVQRLRNSSTSSSRSRSGTHSPSASLANATINTLTAPHFASHHSRIRSDSAPEAWNRRPQQDDGELVPSDDASNRSSSFRTGASKARSSFTSSLIRFRKGKNKRHTDGTNTPTNTSLLTASRPQPSRVHSLFGRIEHASTTENGTSNADDPSSTVRTSGAATSSTLRRPALLQPHRHTSPLASSTVAVASGSILEPVQRSISPEPPRRNFFDELLPREIKLRIFASLIEAIMEDCQADSSSKRKTKRLAPQDAPLSQLASIGRVSKGWASLTLDGQLWGNLNFSPFDGAQFDAMLRLSASVGSFLRHLNLAGLTNLPSHAFMSIVKSSLTTCSSPSSQSFVGASLRSINISHCQTISEDALIRALRCCPSLRSLTARNVSSMSNAVLMAVAETADNLQELDIGGNSGVTGHGVEMVVTSCTQIRVLKISGASAIHHDLMRILGEKATQLEVLDLSYCRSLDDDAFLAYLATTDMTSANLPKTFSFVPSQRSARDPFVQLQGVYRRITNLRSLSISGCRRISDRACALLAGAVPKLEIFQAANIGPTLQDAGVAALLDSTPHLKQLDLDGALELTDEIIEALVLHDTRGGCKLTHLVISHAINITAEALLELVNRAPQLVHLQADDTRAGDVLAREFTRLMRHRHRSCAYLSMVDCRGLSKATAQELAGSGTTRPRTGKEGHAYRHFGYDEDGRYRNNGGPPLLQEFDEHRVTLKSFWGWQAVDARAQAVRKGRARRNARTRSAHNGSGNNSDDEDGSTSRLGRFAALLLTAGEDAENAAGCAVM